MNETNQLGQKINLQIAFFSPATRAEGISGEVEVGVSYHEDPSEI